MKQALKIVDKLVLQLQASKNGLRKRDVMLFVDWDRCRTSEGKGLYTYTDFIIVLFIVILLGTPEI